MPLYEYTCKACGKDFEHLAKSHSAPAPSCPKCESTKVEKKFSVFGATVKKVPAASGCHSCPSRGACAARNG